MYMVRNMEGMELPITTALTKPLQIITCSKYITDYREY